MGKNKLIGHILENMQEVGIAKGNTFDAQLKWKKRQWDISPEIKEECFIYDKKHRAHCWLDVNQADGTYHFLTPEKLNLFTSARDVIDKCGECGGQISIDAQVHRIVNQRNIVKSFWGLDNSYMLLILLLGIVCVILVGALFFVIGELNKTNTLLQKYLVPTQTSNTVTAKFLMPYIGVYE